MSGNGSREWNDDTPTPAEGTRILTHETRSVIMAIDEWRAELSYLGDCLTALRAEIISEPERHPAYFEERLLDEKRGHTTRMLNQVERDEARIRVRKEG